MADYPPQGTQIDNDFHPIDQGTEASIDHWGTTSLKHAMNEAIHKMPANPYVKHKSNAENAGGIGNRKSNYPEE